MEKAEGVEEVVEKKNPATQEGKTNKRKHISADLRQEHPVSTSTLSET